MSTADDVAEAAVLGGDGDEPDLTRQRAQHIQPRTACGARLLPLPLSQHCGNLSRSTGSTAEQAWQGIVLIGKDS